MVMWSCSAGTGNWEMKWWHNKKKCPFGINKCRVYVTWPFLSLVQTTECQGTTSQQHGCKAPRLKPLELLRPNRRNTTFKMWLQRKVGFSYTSGEKRMHLFFQRGKRNTRIWGTAAEVGHRRGGMQMGSAAVNQHTINNQPSNIFYSPGRSPQSSPMYCIVPHMVNARPPRFSRRESPKSDKRRWPEWKQSVGFPLRTTCRRTSFRLHCSSQSSHDIVFFYLDHLQAHFPSKNTQKEDSYFLKVHSCRILTFKNKLHLYIPVDDP